MAFSLLLVNFVTILVFVNFFRKN